MDTIPHTQTVASHRLKTTDLVFIAIFAALMAICSWITIPFTVPFTMQTFGVFVSVGILGGKRGTLSVLVFLLLGAIGLPVFSGFSGGFGVILGTTGGYLVGFLLSAFEMWKAEELFGHSPFVQIASMLIGLLLCYILGTVWFMFVYMNKTGPIGLFTVLGWCVFPFIIPDLVKIGLAFLLSKRLKKYVPV